MAPAARALAARATGRGRGRRGRGRQRPPSSAAAAAAAAGVTSQLVRWQRLLLGRLRASPRSTRAGTRAASASYAKGESARRLSKHKSNEQGKHGWGVADAAKASFEPECAGCRRPHLEIEEEDRHTPTPGWARRRHHWARVRSMRGRRESARRSVPSDRCIGESCSEFDVGKALFSWAARAADSRRFSIWRAADFDDALRCVSQFPEGNRWKASHRCRRRRPAGASARRHLR